MSAPPKYMWFRRSVEIAWLFVMAVCVFEIINNLIKGEDLKAVLFAAVGVLAGIMFTIRRNQRKKLEKRK
jgi:glucose uptake protein GlcU